MPAHFRSENLDPNTGKMIDATINRELAFSLFKHIADTHAPSQSVSYTRGRTIERILNEHIHQPLHFEADYRQTGNIAVMLGETPSALLIAHADEISYLLGTEPLGKELRLTPFCSDR